MSDGPRFGIAGVDPEFAANFDPDQPRDENGRFVSTGGMGQYTEDMRYLKQKQRQEELTGGPNTKAEKQDLGLERKEWYQDKTAVAGQSTLVPKAGGDLKLGKVEGTVSLPGHSGQFTHSWGKQTGSVEDSRKALEKRGYENPTEKTQPFPQTVFSHPKGHQAAVIPDQLGGHSVHVYEKSEGQQAWDKSVVERDRKIAEDIKHPFRRKRIM